MPDSEGEVDRDKLQIVESDGLFTLPDTKSGQYPHELPGHQGLESLLLSKTDESSLKTIPQNKTRAVSDRENRMGVQRQGSDCQCKTPIENTAVSLSIGQ